MIQFFCNFKVGRRKVRASCWAKTAEEAEAIFEAMILQSTRA